MDKEKAKPEEDTDGQVLKREGSPPRASLTEALALGVLRGLSPEGTEGLPTFEVSSW